MVCEAFHCSEVLKSEGALWGSEKEMKINHQVPRTLFGT